MKKTDLKGIMKGKPAVVTDEGATAEAVKPKKEKVIKPKKERRDNIAYVTGRDSIETIRKFKTIAVAKRAKSVGRAEAIARYTAEEEAAAVRLEELLTEVKTSADPLKKALELHEEPNKVVTLLIEGQEAVFGAWCEEQGDTPSRATLKKFSDDIPVSFFELLPDTLHPVMLKRSEKSDFRFKAICKKVNFMALVAAGTVTKIGNKWLTAEELEANKKAEADKEAEKAAKEKAKEDAKAAKAKAREEAKAIKDAEKAEAKRIKEEEKAKAKELKDADPAEEEIEVADKPAF